MAEHELNIRNVSCVGRCVHAPSFVINDRYYDGFSPDEAVSAVVQTIGGFPPRASSYRRSEMRLASDPYDGERPYSALRKYVQSRDWPVLMDSMKAGGLKGMRAAGHPTDQKCTEVRI